MSLFSAPSAPPTPPPLPSANPPTYASGSTLSSLTARPLKPWGGTDPNYGTAGEAVSAAGKPSIQALGLTATGQPGGVGTAATAATAAVPK